MQTSATSCPHGLGDDAARGKWRRRFASEASRNGQERQIRHWQGGVGGQEVRRKPVGRANSAKSGTGNGQFDAKRPIAPNQALATGSLTPRCALEASRIAKSGTDKGEFERKARKGSPRESRGGTRTRTTGDLVKLHFCKNMSFPCRRELDPTIWPKRTQRKV